MAYGARGGAPDEIIAQIVANLKADLAGEGITSAQVLDYVPLKPPALPFIAVTLQSARLSRAGTDHATIGQVQTPGMTRITYGVDVGMFFGSLTQEQTNPGLLDRASRKWVLPVIMSLMLHTTLHDDSTGLALCDAIAIPDATWTHAVLMDKQDYWGFHWPLSIGTLPRVPVG